MGFLDSLSELMSFDKPRVAKPRAISKSSTKTPLVRVAETKKVIPVKVILPKKESKVAEKKAIKAIRKKLAKKVVAMKNVSQKQATIESNETPSPYQGKEERAAIARENLRRELVSAPSEHCFWMCDGRVLADLEELGAALAEIEDDVFSHHVTDDRHDFAQWVEDILCDGDCANKLRETKNRHDARRVVVEALTLYA